MEKEEIDQPKPFDFLKNYDPVNILNLIKKEMPQTIAVVLSYLEPNKAAILLQNLPNETQSDVSRRIACMGCCAAETIRKLEKTIEKKLSSYSDNYSSGGVESLVEILNLTDHACEKQIIEALEDDDPELAEEVKNRMFVFKDILDLGDRSIQKVMREVDSQELAMALKAVDAQVQEKIFKNMSKRAAAMLKEDMEYMGPVRLVDVEAAQKKILDIVRHLEDTGEIVIARRGNDNVIYYDYNDNESGQKANNETELKFSGLKHENPYEKDNVFKFIISETNSYLLKLALTICDPVIYKAFLKQMTLAQKWKFKKIKCNSYSLNEYNNAQNEIVSLYKEWQEMKEVKENDSENTNNGTGDVLLS